MSVDRRLEDGGRLLVSSARAVDAGIGLDALHRSRSRRRAAQATGALTAVVAVLVAVGMLAAPHVRSTPPVVPVPPSPSVCSAASADPCAGGATYAVVAGSTSFTWWVPVGWSTGVRRHGALADPTTTLATAAAWPTDDDPRSSGVLVLADAVPSDAVHPEATAAAGTDALGLARWVASRPYLAAGALVSTSVAGRPAWQVDVSVGPLGTATSVHWADLGQGPGCGCPRMAAVLRGAAARAGTPRDVLLLQESHAFRLWFLDVPGAGVLVVRAAGSGAPTADASAVVRSLVLRS